MVNLKESTDKEVPEVTKEDNLNHKIKKYNVHGKITTGLKPGTIEISYYECDDIQCNKKIIK